MNLKSFITFLFFAAVFSFTAQNNNSRPDQLKMISVSGDTNTVNRYFTLSAKIWATNTDSALYYEQAALSVSKKIKFIRGACKSLIDIITLYTYSDNYDSAMAYSDTLLLLSQDKQLKWYKSNAYQLKGVVMRRSGNYAIALTYFFNALSIADSLKEPHLTASLKSSIASVYSDNGDTENSLKFTLAALDGFMAAKDSSKIGRCYSNLGIHYLVLKDTAKSIENSLKGRWYFNAIHAEGNVLESDFNLSDILFARHLNDSAVNCAKRFYQFGKKVKNKLVIMSGLNKLGYFYAGSGKTKEAISAYKEGLLAASETKNFSAMVTSYAGLSYCYEKTGDLANALSTYKEFKNYSDSLSKLSNGEIMANILAKAEFEKKEKEAEQKRILKEAVTDAELKKHRILTYAGFSVGGIILILLIIVFRSYNQKKKANILIEHQKNSVEEKQKEILDSIRYAKRIQTTLLTPEKYIERKLRDMNR